MAWKKMGSGCDKAFYWDEEDSYGWLNFKSQSVIDAELEARGKLTGLSVIPPIDVSRGAPDLEDVDKPLGYYIQRVNLSKTFKPLMYVLMPVNRLFASIAKDAGRKDALVASLQEILDSLDTICAEVGELTIGMDEDTGKAYLLDLAKAEGGQTVKSGNQQVKVRQGLEKMIGFLTS